MDSRTREMRRTAKTLSSSWTTRTLISRGHHHRDRCDYGPEVRRKTRITHRMVPHVYSGAHVRSHKKGNSLRGKPESAARVTSCVSLALAYSGARGEWLAGALQVEPNPTWVRLPQRLTSRQQRANEAGRVGAWLRSRFVWTACLPPGCRW